MKTLQSVGRLLLAFVLAIGAAVWLAVTALPTVRDGALTALLLPELLNAGGPRPLLFVSEAPQRTELHFAGADADLYRPTGGGRHGGLVVTLGVHPLDKRDPVVVRVAEGLARAGLVVMVVQSDALLAGQLDPAEADVLVAAVERLREDPGVDPARVGLLGFSAGASLAMLAAADARDAADVRALVWVGGFADATQLVRQISTRQFDDDGTVIPWQPDALTIDVFRRQLIAALPDPTDRAVLTARYIASTRGAEPTAPEQTASLSPDGRTLAGLFDTTDPATVDHLIAALPPTVAQQLAALSPIRVVDRFQGRAFILVDRSDPLVPYVQSRALARALPPAHVATYTEFDLLEDVQPTRPLPPLTFVHEVWKLASVVHAVLLDLDPAA